ncbi:MAG: MOSC domain-containing protein [Gemmatimonadaceae bacterium]
MSARVASLNRSPGGVPKLAVAEAAVSAHGMAGDRQRDLRHHGGPDRALCLYSLDLITALRREGHPIAPGTVGENVTIEGLDWRAVVPGTRLRLGDAEVEITSYAVPCRNINGSFADGRSVRISQKLHPGWSRAYARVLRGALLRTGDPVAFAAPAGEGDGSEVSRPF